MSSYQIRIDILEKLVEKRLKIVLAKHQGTMDDTEAKASFVIDRWCRANSMSLSSANYIQNIYLELRAEYSSDILLAVMRPEIQRMPSFVDDNNCDDLKAIIEKLARQASIAVGAEAEDNVQALYLNIDNWCRRIGVNINSREQIKQMCRELHHDGHSVKDLLVAVKENISKETNINEVDVYYSDFKAILKFSTENEAGLRAEAAKKGAEAPKIVATDFFSSSSSSEKARAEQALINALAKQKYYFELASGREKGYLYAKASSRADEELLIAKELASKFGISPDIEKVTNKVNSLKTEKRIEEIKAMIKKHEQKIAEQKNIIGELDKKSESEEQANQIMLKHIHVINILNRELQMRQDQLTRLLEEANAVKLDDEKRSSSVAGLASSGSSTFVAREVPKKEEKGAAKGDSKKGEGKDEKAQQVPITLPQTIGSSALFGEKKEMALGVLVTGIRRDDKLSRKEGLEEKMVLLFENCCRNHKDISPISICRKISDILQSKKNEDSIDITQEEVMNTLLAVQSSSFASTPPASKEPKKAFKQ